jgi:hypothetical protein
MKGRDLDDVSGLLSRNVRSGSDGGGDLIRTNAKSRLLHGLDLRRSYFTDLKVALLNIQQAVSYKLPIERSKDGKEDKLKGKRANLVQ